MQVRSTPIAVPDRWPYVVAGVPDVEGSPWTFRIPRSTAGLQTFLDALQPMLDASTVTAEAAETLTDAAYSLIADLWAHPTLALGEDPAEDLYEAGLSESLAIKLATELVAQRGERVVKEKEVAARASFFDATVPSTG